MKNLTAALCAAAIIPGAWASTYSDNLGKCILANTSSDDQVVMTQWAYVTLGKTDAARKVQTISDAKTKAVEEKAKALVSRLALGACSKQFATVIAKEPTTGLQNAATYVATSLLKDQVVNSGLSLFPSLKSSNLISNDLVNSETIEAVGSLLKNVLKK